MLTIYAIAEEAVYSSLEGVSRSSEIAVTPLPEPIYRILSIAASGVSRSRL